MIGTAGPASAAPVDSEAKLNAIDLSALTTQARAALEAAPAVTVADDAQFTVESAAVKVTPAPEVKAAPKAEKQERRQATSRTQTRTATAAASTASIPASAVGSSVISIAARYQGVPYVYGGSTPDGFDCSGFVSYVYAQLGISLPHSSSAIGGMGTRVPRSQAQAGDIIWTPGHVSIYAGNNMQIDASRPGTTIQFRPMWQSNATFIRLG